MKTITLDTIKNENDDDDVDIKHKIYDMKMIFITSTCDKKWGGGGGVKKGSKKQVLRPKKNDLPPPPLGTLYSIIYYTR
jgi:hypothetical protein